MSKEPPKFVMKISVNLRHISSSEFRLLISMSCTKMTISVRPVSQLVPVHKRPLKKKGTFLCFQSRNEDFCPRSRKSSVCAEA